MVLAYAKCGDQTIDRLPHGVATTPQRAIVPRCLPHQVGTACFERQRNLSAWLSPGGALIRHAGQAVAVAVCRADELRVMMIDFELSA